MGWVAVAVIGGSVLSGMMGSKSAKRAASAQAGAMREATALQREMYNTTRNDLSQYRDVGGKNLAELDKSMPELTKSFTMSDFTKDPGYDFRMQEGQKALERSAAARGGLMGGAAGKALSRYGQDYASNEYSNAYNRFNSDRDQRFNKLSSLASMGHNAAAQSGSAAQNFGQQAGENIIGGGNSQAASQIAGGNAWAGAINQAVGGYAAFGNHDKKLQQPEQLKVGEQGYTLGSLRVSDRRLKKNIVRLETSQFKDVPTYEFEYLDQSLGEGKFIGVMAQDLLAIDPQHPAVVQTDLGFAVNYSKLGAA